MCGEGDAEGIEACAALVGDAVAGEAVCLQGAVYDACVAAPGAEYEVGDAVGFEKGEELECGLV